MASLTAISGKLVFKLDSGEVKDGRTVYRSVAVGGVDGSKTAEALAGAAGVVKGLIRLNTEQISLTRSDLLSL